MKYDYIKSIYNIWYDSSLLWGKSLKQSWYLFLIYIILAKFSSNIILASYPITTIITKFNAWGFIFLGILFLFKIYLEAILFCKLYFINNNKNISLLDLVKCVWQKYLKVVISVCVVFLCCMLLSSIFITFIAFMEFLPTKLKFLASINVFAVLSLFVKYFFSAVISNFVSIPFYMEMPVTLSNPVIVFHYIVFNFVFIPFFIIIPIVLFYMDHKKKYGFIAIIKYILNLLKGNWLRSFITLCAPFFVFNILFIFMHIAFSYSNVKYLVFEAMLLQFLMCSFMFPLTMRYINSLIKTK